MIALHFLEIHCHGKRLRVGIQMVLPAGAVDVCIKYCFHSKKAYGKLAIWRGRIAFGTVGSNEKGSSKPG